MKRYQDYAPEIAKILAFTELEVVKLLKHGFGKIAIKCKIGNGKRRELIVQPAESEKFTIDPNELPD